MFKQLTNTKPVKDATPMLVTTPTEGNMRLSGSAASIIGVGAGSYLGVVSDEDDNIFIHKGQGGEGVQNVGSKLATAGGNFNLSSVNAYNAIGGNSTTNLIFEVATEAKEIDGIEYYALTLLRTEDKQERKAAAESDAAAPAEAAPAVDGGSEEASAEEPVAAEAETESEFDA